MVTAVHSSRAGSLALVGGELALDFANTSSGRGSSDHKEHLQRPLHVAQWAAHARLLAPDDAAWLAAAAETDANLGARLLREALALREDIYELGAALAAGHLAPPERIKSLTKSHARALGRGRLTPIDGNFGWAWSPREAPVEAVVGPISLSALTLLQQADLARVKQCQGDECGWLFFDTTKNKSRRWCEMKVCGNRAKQKRFGAKSHRG
jgi:predicted RNA-binding Zn ribbon-like protein